MGEAVAISTTTQSLGDTIPPVGVNSLGGGGATDGFPRETSGTIRRMPKQLQFEHTIFRRAVYEVAGNKRGAQKQRSSRYLEARIRAAEVEERAIARRLQKALGVKLFQVLL